MAYEPDPLCSAAFDNGSLIKHGTNSLTPPEKDPLWQQWVEKFEDPTIIILCICAGTCEVTDRNWHGAWGVLLDDIVSGLYAAGIVWLAVKGIF